MDSWASSKSAMLMSSSPSHKDSSSSSNSFIKLPRPPIVLPIVDVEETDDSGDGEDDETVLVMDGDVFLDFSGERGGDSSNLFVCSSGEGIGSVCFGAE